MKSMIQNDNFNKKNKFYELINDLDFFPAYEGRKINIIFSNESIKINVVTPLNCKIKELLNAFHIKLQIYGKDNNIKIMKLNEYMFICNGHLISLNEETTIFDLGSIDPQFIIFKSKNEIIGG